MEVSLSGPKVTVAANPETLRASKSGLYPPTRIRYRRNRSGFAIRASRCRPIKAVPSKQVEKNQKSAKKNQAVELFVGLPLDTICVNNTIKHERAIKAGLRALKLLGVHGVELPVYWAVVQPDSSDQFNWSSYISIADMARCAGLKLRVSLQLNGSEAHNIMLPNWVLRIAESDPDILFKDKSGQSRKDCLNFAVDELVVLQGKKPVEVFEGFFMSFKSEFQEYFGSTITDISISLGPNGEFRYPNYPPRTKPSQYKGPGEFQCYDKYTLSNLKSHSERSNNPLWGLSGPHNTPAYNQAAETSEFFRDSNGSWETRYGEFFLSWYSQSLLDHGTRVLDVVRNVFGDLDVGISAKVPYLGLRRGMRVCAAELTAGFYNTVNRDGYDGVVKLFGEYNVVMIISGLDLESGDKNFEVLSEIKRSCEKYGVVICGENLELVKRESNNGFDKIKEKLILGEMGIESLMYGRMGAEFFSPEHWPLFMEFVRGLERREMDSDDVVSENEKGVSVKVLEQGKEDRKMQAV
ncbi:hypothetical protein LUZ60_013992 [Juncus effusus]|nr:hypothetical protein LUZ60_013992 [Juncus effusus]